jgi:hypothetical protein
VIHRATFATDLGTFGDFVATWSDVIGELLYGRTTNSPRHRLTFQAL